MAAFDDLIAQAKALNIPINSNFYKPKDLAWNELQITEYELYRRINEEKRNRREQKLWLVAVIAAIASAISALGSLIAALK